MRSKVNSYYLKKNKRNVVPQQQRDKDIISVLLSISLKLLSLSIDVQFHTLCESLFHFNDLSYCITVSSNFNVLNSSFYINAFNIFTVHYFLSM